MRRFKITRNMSRFFALAVLLLAARSMWAQTETPSIEKFFLQPNGSFLTSENKDFIVIDCPGKSQEELYNDFLTAITKLYASPKHVVEKVDNRIIKITAYDFEAFTIESSEYSFGNKPREKSYATNYCLQFQFKENKVRVDTPTIISLNEYYITGHLSDYKEDFSRMANRLFSKYTPYLKGDKKDERKIEKADRINREHKDAIIVINNYANHLLKIIIRNSLVPDNGSDW